MIYIENLIETENRLPSNPATLKTVLGDTFLYNQNKIFRNRREMALQQKIKFKKADNSYNTSSLLCLPQILKQKSVPFSENKNALINLDLPAKKITVDDLVFLGTKKNHLLHETSHVIMWLVARRTVDLSVKIELMTALLLSESYANYSETIANCFAKTELHRHYLALNSFWSYSSEEVKTLSLLQKKYGKLTTNTAMFLCFLYANFLYKKISAYECESIRLFIGNQSTKLSTSEIKDLFAIASQLNIHFLIKTGEIFWKTLGVDGNLFENLDFDPIDFLLQNPKLRNEILELISND